MTIILGYLILLLFTGFVVLVIWEAIAPTSPNRYGIASRREPRTRAVLAIIAVLIGIIVLVLLTNVGAST